MADAAPPVHRWPVRVYYEDTDAGGIVYHAGYLRFAERARTELLRNLGFDHRTLLREHGVLFAVRRLEVDFLASAVLDDQLSVLTSLVRAGGASLDLDQVVERAGATIARLRVRLALLDRRQRVARLPAPLRLALARLPAGAERG